MSPRADRRHQPRPRAPRSAGPAPDERAARRPTLSSTPHAPPVLALRARPLSDCALFAGSAPYEKLVRYSEESLAIFDALGEAYCVERAHVLMWLGFRLYFLLDARDKGTRYRNEALRTFEEAGDKWNQAFEVNLFGSAIFEISREF